MSQSAFPTDDAYVSWAEFLRSGKTGALALVCLAVWLCFGARSMADKILAIVFPITAFVALGGASTGFQHVPVSEASRLRAWQHARPNRAGRAPPRR